MQARDLLSALVAAGLPVRGLRIYDESDASQWHFDGTLTADEEQRAQQIVREALRPAPAPSAVWWPKPPDPLVARVAVIEARLGIA